MSTSAPTPAIDRGALADTIIEDGVKLDNQIQIGHNCHIGAHTAMAGCVGVAGSAKIGKYCTFGGAAMVLGHLTIADHVHISSGSMVSRSILEAGQYTGFYPLAKNADWEKTAAIVRNLDTMRDKIRALEKTIKTTDRTKMTDIQAPSQNPAQDKSKQLDICADQGAAAAPLSHAAGRPRADLGSQQDHHRHQERHRQRRILQWPFPAQTRHAGRA